MPTKSMELRHNLSAFDIIFPFFVREKSTITWHSKTKSIELWPRLHPGP